MQPEVHDLLLHVQLWLHLEQTPTSLLRHDIEGRQTLLGMCMTCTTQCREAVMHWQALMHVMASAFSSHTFPCGSPLKYMFTFSNVQRSRCTASEGPRCPGLKTPLLSMSRSHLVSTVVSCPFPHGPHQDLSLRRENLNPLHACSVHA